MQQAELNHSIISRKCYKCQETKTLDSNNFHRSKNRTLGFEYKCKSCENKRTKTNRKDWSKYTDEQKATKYANRRKHKNVYKIKYKHLSTLSAYRTTDKEKGRAFNLTSKIIAILLKQPCVYCGYPATGLDRINNKIGHTVENCLPCCLECNHARNDNFTHKEMFLIGKTIREIKDNRKILSEKDNQLTLFPCPVEKSAN